MSTPTGLPKVRQDNIASHWRNRLVLIPSLLFDHQGFGFAPYKYTIRCWMANAWLCSSDFSHYLIHSASIAGQSTG